MTEGFAHAEQRDIVRKLYPDISVRVIEHLLDKKQGNLTAVLTQCDMIPKSGGVSREPPSFPTQPSVAQVIASPMMPKQPVIAAALKQASQAAPKTQTQQPPTSPGRDKTRGVSPKRSSGSTPSQSVTTPSGLGFVEFYNRTTKNWDRVQYDVMPDRINLYIKKAMSTLYFDDCPKILTNCDSKSHEQAVRNGKFKYVGFQGQKSFLLLRTSETKVYDSLCAPLQSLPQHEECVGPVSPANSPRKVTPTAPRSVSPRVIRVPSPKRNSSSLIPPDQTSSQQRSMAPFSRSNSERSISPVRRAATTMTKRSKEVSGPFRFTGHAHNFEVAPVSQFMYNPPGMADLLKKEQKTAVPGMRSRSPRERPIVSPRSTQQPREPSPMRRSVSPRLSSVDSTLAKRGNPSPMFRSTSARLQPAQQTSGEYRAPVVGMGSWVSTVDGYRRKPR